MKGPWVKPFFVIAALYDGILGIAFLFWWPAIFVHFGVRPPNHGGYVQFPALLLLIFAAMFLRIAREPLANRALILYGVALKASYCGLVFWYDYTEGVSRMWIPFAWADAAFLVIFVAVWSMLERARSLPSSA